MNRTLIAQKLAQIAACLLELKPVLQVDHSAFASTPAHFRLAERDVQLIVDSAVDINNHIMIEAGGTPPPTYYESFIALGRLKVIPAARARRLASTAGLRNRIVHQYENVDLRILHRSLESLVREYAAYARAIRAHARI